MKIEEDKSKGTLERENNFSTQPGTIVLMDKWSPYMLLFPNQEICNPNLWNRSINFTAHKNAGQTQTIESFWIAFKKLKR